MKKPLFSTLVAASLLTIAQTGSAEILLTDNFNVSALSTDPNFEINGGRQGGTFAGSNYTFTTTTSGFPVLAANASVGDSPTNVGQPVGSDFLLLKSNAAGTTSTGVQLQGLNIPTLVAGQPLVISFDMYTTGDDASNPGFSATGWSSFALRILNRADPQSGQTGFGFLKRYNGQIQMFNNGNTASYDPGASVISTDPHWVFTFTNTAGTGSAFAGQGSKVSWVNGSITGSLTLNQLASSGLYVGFESLTGNFGGIDNLSISTIPEPSAYGCAVVAGLGILIVSRRRRLALA